MKEYAFNMVRSYNKFNPEGDSVSINHLGGYLPNDNWRSVSIIVAKMLPPQGNHFLWMDADALILDNIDDLFNGGDYLLCMQNQDGDPALGTWSTSFNYANTIANKYLEMHPKGDKDEGEFIRENQSLFNIKYYNPDIFCCRDDVLTVEEVNNNLWAFQKNGSNHTYCPRVIHFNTLSDGSRPKNPDIENWTNDNL